MASDADRCEVAVVVGAVLAGRCDVVDLGGVCPAEVALVPVSGEDAAAGGTPVGWEGGDPPAVGGAVHSGVGLPSLLSGVPLPAGGGALFLLHISRPPGPA